MRIDNRKGYKLNEIQLSNLKSLLYSALILELALIFSMPAAAQRITGTLRKQILDPSNAAMPDAQVTATNQKTDISMKITTTSTGTYSFPSLIPNMYKINIEAKDFKNFLKSEITITTNQNNVANANIN